MAAEELVSIVIPCYNAERYVCEAIESAIGQSYEHIEVIVVDDGSTDDSLNAIESFGAAIRWQVQKNRGACAARNLGVRLARGRFVKFLDADDVLAPQVIEQQVEQSRPFDEGRTIVYGHWGHMDACGTNRRLHKTSSRPPRRGSQISFLLSHNINTQAPLHRRTFLLEVGGFDEQLHHAQEYDLHLRLSLSQVRFHYQPILSGFLRCHDNDKRISNQNFVLTRPEAELQKSQKRAAMFERALSGETLEIALSSVAQGLWRKGRIAHQHARHAEANEYMRAAQRIHSNYLRGESLLYSCLVRLFSPQLAEEIASVARKVRKSYRRLTFP